jgi:hypothetical protein
MARFAAPRATAEVTALAPCSEPRARLPRRRRRGPAGPKEGGRRPTHGGGQLAVNQLRGTRAPIYASWRLRAALLHELKTSHRPGALSAPLKS